MSEYHQDLRDQRRADGVCIWCPRRAARGKVLCRTCARKHKRNAEARREEGLCQRCGSDYDGVMWACDDCRALQRGRPREGPKAPSLEAVEVLSEISPLCTRRLHALSVHVLLFDFQRARRPRGGAYHQGYGGSHARPGQTDLRRLVRAPVAQPRALSSQPDPL